MKLLWIARLIYEEPKKKLVNKIPFFVYCMCCTLKVSSLTLGSIVDYSMVCDPYTKIIITIIDYYDYCSNYNYYDYYNYCNFYNHSLLLSSFVSR